MTTALRQAQDTATLARPPTQAPTEPYESPESRLAACDGYIRDAAWRCARRYYSERWLEDMTQEAALAVWHKLEECPDASDGLIWIVSYRAAYNFLCRGNSVDKPMPLGKVRYYVDSLEALLDGNNDQDTVDDALARRRHGELPNPTEDIAVARIMEQELQECLTPRQRQVLTLHLRGCTEQEVAAILGIAQSRVSCHVAAIRIKALAVWGDTPQKPARVKLTPEEATERRRVGDRRRHKTWLTKHREAINAKRRAWRAQHRGEYNARQQARRREKRADSR